MEPTDFLPGFALFGLGFALFFGLLASEGALAKDKQFSALARVSSGAAGSRARAVLLLAAVCAVAGACLLFGAVARGDHRRAERCTAACASRGFSRGVIRASTERHPTRPGAAAFVACACEGGGAPTIELPANDL